MQQSLGSEKLRSVSLPNLLPEVLALLCHRIVSSSRESRQLLLLLQPAPKSNESEKMWHYKDPSANESSLDSVLLTDALAGLFQKQAQTAPSVLDIPKNSQDTWSSGGSLPSLTPTQMTTPTAKGEILRVDGLLPSLLHSGMQSWGNMQTDKFDSHGRARGDALFFSEYLCVLWHHNSKCSPPKVNQRFQHLIHGGLQFQANQILRFRHQHGGMPNTGWAARYNNHKLIQTPVGVTGQAQSQVQAPGVVQALDGCRQVKGCSLGTVIKTGELKTRQQCQVVGQEGTKLVTGETNRARMEILDMVGTGSLVEVVGITTSKGKEYAVLSRKWKL
ncbi:hypothetical protein Bca52824_031763 [Brassica carinata]|uniref:Uncharacterized protein n=1 Tax=Brassica carinata TaxID=52824 RepID=A0A8X7SBA0_BRACI|nr:hypothetical protein Bca52824_031763 [Brassica carinata]